MPKKGYKQTEAHKIKNAQKRFGLKRTAESKTKSSISRINFIKNNGFAFKSSIICCDCGNISKRTGSRQMRCFLCSQKNAKNHHKKKNVRYCKKCGEPLNSKFIRICGHCIKKRRSIFIVDNPVKKLKLRFRILMRDNFTCIYCGRRPPEVSLEIDHQYPQSLGGKNMWNNLVTSCRDCNGGKGDMILK